MIQLLSTFFIISLTGALSPGPLTTMAIAEGSRRGRWAGWWLSVGHGLAEGIYVAIIATLLWLGRETLLEQPLVAGAIAVIGGLFLGWMGWSMGRAAWQREISLAGDSSDANQTALIPAGIFFSISNPYWWIWWALLVSLYIRDSLAWGAWGVVALFFVHWLTDIGWLTGLSWLTGAGHNLISAAVYRWIIIFCGAALLFFGIWFVYTGFQFLSSGTLTIG